MARRRRAATAGARSTRRRRRSWTATFVDRPLYTGSKIIDTMIPIGKGQRQLLIGDNGLGKSALAIDTVINQRGKNVKCVYVLVGQKRSTVVNTIDVLRAHGALEHTAVVVAEATALPGLKYLAPFAGCAVAESWMQFGDDTLVVYDDITTHAQTYRELSLLLQRPPGREAYPGDIFYLHSRLLERATCLAPAAGGGSMTALPIVETKQGEIASYIPTNLISITDGQVYLDKALFDAGSLPAIDVTRSVSRIGGNAQHPRIKQEAGRTKLDYLQFLELEVFTRFGTRLEPAMEKRIRRGRALREALKQDRLAPLPIEFQMAWLTAFNEGLLEDADPKRISEKAPGPRRRARAPAAHARGRAGRLGRGREVLAGSSERMSERREIDAPAGDARRRGRDHGSAQERGHGRGDPAAALRAGAAAGRAHGGGRNAGFPDALSATAARGRRCG